MRKTLNQVLAQYGVVGVVVYLALFTLVLGGSWAAINLGWRPESLTGNVGSFTAAYLATKVTLPLRWAATIALTPMLAKAYERVVRPRVRGEETAAQ